MSEDIKTELKTCDEHGDYQAPILEFMGTKFKSPCPECSKESSKARELKEKEENEKLERKRYLRVRDRAGISKRNLGVTLDSIVPASKAQSHALETLKSYSQEILKGKADNNIIIIGGVGTGKTIISSALVDSLVERKSARIRKCIDLVRELKSTWSKDSESTESEVIHHYSTLHLLVIDEVGVQFGSDTEKMFLFDIVDGRYQNMLPTVLISNLNMDGIKELVGERAVDRMREGGGKLLVLDGESCRR